MTRIGKDVLGGQTYNQSQNLTSMSPNGQYVTGVRLGSTIRGYVMTTTLPVVTDIPKVDSTHPYGHGNDVNDAGDVVGYEKWTVGNTVNIIPWFYDRSAGTVTSLYSALNPTVTAIPSAITNDSAYAFGTIDQDGAVGPIVSQGVYWNVSTKARTVISGVREVVDASSDGSVLLVVDSTGNGKVLRGSIAAGWSTTVATLGVIQGGKVSPDGRYVGTAEKVGYRVYAPLVYDTVSGTRTNLALRSGDTLGAVVGAISDTGRVLGSVNTTSSAGSFAVGWLTPTSSYTTFLEVLSTDGHTTADSSYFAWNIYHGGDGISADGLTMGIYGTNVSVLEDSMIFQQKCPVITLTSSVPAAVVGTSYDTTLTATNGTAPYTFAVATGVLPTGLALNAGTGAITGIPASNATASFTVRVQDAYGCFATRSYTLTPSCPTITLSPTTLPDGTVSVSYSQTITVTGGTSPMTYAVSAGTLPAGLTLNASTGAITGTPTTSNGAGTSITIRATDNFGCVGTRTYALKVCPAVVLSPTSMPAALLGQAYSQTITISGGASPYVYSLPSGTLPAGLSLNTSTGVISGTPTTTGSSVFTLRAVDANGCAGTRSYSMSVACPTLSLSPASLTDGLIGLGYSQPLSGSGGAAPYTYSITSGTLPAGLTLNASSGVISGTPTASNGAGASITVRVADNVGCSATRSYTLKICPMISVNPTTIVNGTVGTAYSQTVTASGGASPYVYSVSSGTLPVGLSLNASTGAITGTPTSSSSTLFTLRAVDANGCTGTRSYTVAPFCNSVTVAPELPNNAVINTAYTQTFTAGGGTSPYTWAVTSGALPTGLALNASTGVVSGTPTVANGAGTTFTLRATDNAGCQGTANVTLIVCPVISLSPTSLSNGTMGLNYTATVTASGGAAPYAYSVSSGSLPDGLSLTSSTGGISGLPTTAASSTFTVRAVDSNGCTGTRAYSLTMAAATSDFGDYSPFGSASSTVNSKLRIGALVDAEGAAIANSTATGDDEFGSDDEDGVTFSSLVQGMTGTATVQITNTRGSTARLNMWIDWNNDGTLSSSEQIANNTSISNGTNNASRVISFTVPADAYEGSVGARVRLTSTSTPGTAGASGIGEVEDHIAAVTSSCPDFAVLVVNYNNNTISRFSGTDGAALTTFSPSGLSSPNYGYRISDNTILIANGSANTITKHNPFTGALISTLVPAGRGLNFPYQMAIAPDSSLYIANQNAGNVLRFNQSTGESLGTVLSVSTPAGLAFSDSGTLYVTSNVSGGALRTYNTSGVLQSVVSTWPSGEYPRGIAWGPDNRLYVNVRNNNSSNGRVDVITFPAGTRSTFVTLDAGSNPYTGIRWGPDGNLYVVDYGENEMDVFSMDGTLVRKITTSLNGPHAVAFSDCKASTKDFGDYSGFETASSAWSTSIRLGNEADVESRARSNAYANGDDIDELDDEDGVTMPDTLTGGSTVTLPVKLLNTSGATAYLSAWVDYNGDGTLSDAEKIINNQSVANGTNGATQNFTFAVPGSVTSGIVGARFRLSSVSNLSAIGDAGIGEVEDYIVTLQPAPVDFGDHAPFAFASSVINSNLRIGTNATDAETTNPANSSATGDDNAGTDDEDTVLPTLTLGGSSTVTLSLFNNTGTNTYLVGWADWNNNGTLDPATEVIIPETTISSSSSSQSRSFTVNVPLTATKNVPLGIRLRLSSLPSVPSTGAYGQGEVEDYQATILCPAITVSPTSLATATTGIAYSQAFTASGGTGAYAYSVSSGSLPAWASLNATTGVLSGTPNSVASAVFTLAATDSSGCVGTRSYTLTPACPALAIAPATLPVGAFGVAYNQTLTATGGASPYTWTITSGTLPSGLTLMPGTGVISGTPTAGNGAGVSLTFRATDANGCQITSAIILKICPVVSVSPASVAAPVLGAAYSQTITASGGVAPYVFSISSGGLPTGLSLNASSGVISGTATTPGAATFTVRATDANGCEGQRPYTVTPACPTVTVTPATLPGAAVGTVYDQTLSATGGIAPYTWAVSSGTLPAGLTLNATTGALGGTPTASNGAGVSVTFRATDANGCQGTTTVSLKVCPVITLSPTTLPAAVVSSAYSQALSAAGGATPYTFAITSGALPTGMSMTTAGVISGTTASSASASFTVAATDANGCAGTRSYALSVGCSVVSISPVSLPSGLVGSSYSQSLTSDYPNGIVAQYYTGTNFTTLALTRRETSIDFEWGGGSPDSSVPVDQFSARWTGQVVPPTTGTYTFRTSTDDGVRLWVNNVLVIDKWVDQSPTSYTATVNLTAGVLATVRMEYYENAGGAVAHLDWSGPNFSMKPVTEWTAYQWAVVDGSLPAGLTLNADTGIISGQFTSADSATFTVRARDWRGCEGTRTYTVTAGCVSITLSPETLPASAVGTAFSQTLTASPAMGLSGEYYSGTNFNTRLLSRTDASINFDWGNGSPDASVPADGFSVRWLGNILPATTGSYTFQSTSDDGIRVWVNNVLVIDKWIDQGSATYTAAVTLTANVAVPIKVEYYENGGSAVAKLQWSGPGITLQPITQWQSYAWSVVNGTLPAGLTLNSNTGVLSGTPTSSNATTFTVRALAANGCSGTRNYTVTPACPTLAISPTSLSAATQFTAYTAQTLTATGGIGGYTWSVSSGTLPTGMSLSAAGVLGGTPTSLPGNYVFVARALDSSNCVVTRAYTLTVNCPAFTLSATSLPSVQQSVAYTPQTLTASGGNSPYTFAITSGALPTGMSLSSGGVISGTPTSVPGSYAFNVRATDAGNCTATRAYTLTVTCPTLTMTPATLLAATQYAAYSQTMTAAGGSGGYAWAITSGSLPTGLTLSTAGVISGTPTAAPGSFNFNVRATDTLNCSVTRSYTLTLGCPVLSIAPATLPSGAATVSYSQTLTASGGTASYTWSLQSGALPSGYTLSSAGVISGTTTAVGGFNFEAKAVDANGCSGVRSYTLSINCPVISITPTSLPDATVGTAYQQTFSASGGGTPYGWTLETGSLPAGVSLSTAGVLGGTPTGAAGTYTFTVAVTDANACKVTRSYSWLLKCPVVTVTTAALAGGTTGVAYSQTLAATGGSGSYTWSIVGDPLPSGLTLSAAGVISGVPTQAISDVITVQARDANNCAGTRELGISIVCPTLILSPSSLGSGYRGVSYSQSLSTSGGSSPYSYSVVTGSLPAGLTLGSSGILSGTPTATGTFAFTIRSTDASACQTSRSFSMAIKGMSLGDLVWNDTNQNGVRDDGEPGLADVTLELFSSADTVAGNGDDVSEDTVNTDENGAYLFTDLAPGRYYVQISPPPSAQSYSSGTQVSTDNGVNLDNNGLQPGGKGTVVRSPVIQLTAAREPGNVAGGTDLDDTIDFAFRTVPVPGPRLLEYNLNTASSGLPSQPSFQNTSVVSSAKLQMENGLNGLLDQSETTANGPILDGALSRRARDWDAAYDSGYDTARTSLTQRQDSAWVRFDMDPTATGTIGNLDLDVRRSGTTAPTQGKAFLTWKDGSNYYTAVSESFSFTSTTSWYSFSPAWTSFLGGATALPTGSQLAGKSFLLEIYFWGGDGSGYLDVDNIILEGNATSAQSLALGDYVWQDLNADGNKNAGEPGLSGVTLQLWRAGNDQLPNTGDDTLQTTTITDANGYYLFSGLTAGKYFVKIPTPDSSWPLASPTDVNDNGEDNDSNGIQPGGSGTAVHSPVIDLALGKEPGNLSSGGINRDLTVDFGFSASLSIGNLVWSDNDNDGVVDGGENGVPGVQVELYSSADVTVNNGDDVKVGSTLTTDDSGAYNFSGLSAGRYYVKITPPASHPRRSTTSVSSDNGVDNDNNGITQADVGTPVYSMMVTLSALTEPGNLVASFGSNAETTIDFGLRPVFTQLGNLVFKDGNNNNRYDDGEGVGGVKVDLLDASGVFLRTTTTNNTSASTRGTYQFTNILPGSYYVRIPASEFASGKGLANTLSLAPASPLDDALDDDQPGGDSGVDNATPAVNGITSPRLTLADHAQPTNTTGETGFRNTLDDTEDDNGNLTVDFGFKAAGPSETGCYHFALADANRDGTLERIADWTPDQFYDFSYTTSVAQVDQFDLVYDAALKRLVLDTTFNQISGRNVDALWMQVSTGSSAATNDHAIIYVDGFNRGTPNLTIYRYNPAQGYQSWQTAANLMVSTASGSTTSADVLQNKVTENGTTVRYQFVVDVSRVNNAANWTSLGVNSTTWQGLIMGGGAGVVLHMVDLTAAPAYASNGALSSFAYTPGSTTESVFETDPNGVFTIATEPCSVSPWVSIGNLVFSDTNHNGFKDAAEVGVSGATVQLFSPGADNAIGGSGVNADVQMGASLVTSTTGTYSFANLVPGKYYVRVSPPSGFPASGGVAVTLDNGINNDNNGSQPGGPGTVLYSPVIDLAVNAEPAAAVDGDGTSGDATIDFGLWSGFSIGDLVWSDLNDNGLKDTTELGVTGVTVDLMSPGADGLIGGTGGNADSVLQTTTTNSSGVYTFRSYAAGPYYVRVTPTSSLSLASSVVSTADNGTNNDSNGTQTAGAGSLINSMIFNLAAGTEPGSTGNTNSETTIDFGLRGCPSITIAPTSLPLVTQLASYSQSLGASGGTSPYAWTISSGNLPSGIALGSSGLVSGTTSAAAGSYSFTARVTDASGCVATRNYTLTVVCPAITISPATLPAPFEGQPYSQSFSAEGGSPAYAWTLSAGMVPPGLILATNGLLSGAATSSGTFNFTVRATDAVGCQVDRSYSVTIQCPVIAISPTTLTAATIGTAYGPVVLTATGGTPSYTWTSTGTLPSGITLSSSGSLSGTPTGAPGNYDFTATVRDSNGCSATRGYTLSVNCGALAISPTSLPIATSSTAYVGQSLTATGGTQPYVWTITTGALPTGMSLSSAGAITGTPSGAAGSYSFTVRATDTYNCSSTRSYSLTLVCPTITVSPTTLPNAGQFSSYSQTLTATGGSGTYTWTRTAGTLPLGMSFSSAGVLNGTPLLAGNYALTFRAQDANGCAGTRSYTLNVGCPAITITPTTLPQGQTNVAYEQTLTASGGSAPYTWSVTSGTLPTGMSVSLLGSLSGTPTSAPGTYTFTVKATDLSLTCSGSQTFSLTLTCPTITLTPESLSNATVGSTYSRGLSSNGGTAPYTYTVTAGSLPAGITMSESGLISGIPTAATTAVFTVRATDVYNCTGTRSYTLSTVCPTITISPTTLPNAYYGVAYSRTLSVTGGNSPYTWSLASGSLPAGFTLSAGGTVGGSSTAFGSYTFSARVTDAYGCAATQSYTFSVKGLTLGNLIYEDANFNGLRDSGEAGVSGVVVQLWSPGADNAIGGSGVNADSQIGSDFTTASGGAYLFQNLQPGRYYVRLTPPSNLSIPGGNPVNADNGVDNDNNSASQPGGAGTTIYSPVVELAAGTEPTVEDSDSDTDLTVDFGLYRGLNVGNLVWQDTDNDGQRDVGEPGIDGVTLELWNSGADGLVGGADDVKLRTTTSSEGGAYSFGALAPGKYYVRIPVPPLTHPLSSASSVLLDNAVDNDDNGHQVAGGAVYGPVITLASGTEPGTTGGGYADNTVDFGLCNVVPTAYVSATQDDSIQTYNPVTGLFSGIFQQPFGTSHNQGDGNPFDVPYAIELGPDGNWYVAHFGAGNLRKISPAGIDMGPALNIGLSLVTAIQQFTIGADGNFYVVDANGGRVVRFSGPLSSNPGQPIGALLPYTFIQQAGIEDLNVGPDGNLYLVIQQGSTREVRRYSTVTGELLNTIVTDTQLVNMVAGGQPVAIVSGIDIHGNILYGVNRSDGEIFKIDLTNPAAPGTPQLVSTISASLGTVDTRDLEVNPGDGKLYITGYSWGKPVTGGAYTSGALLRVDPGTGSIQIFEAPIPTPPGPNSEIWSGPRDVAFGRPFSTLTQTVSIGSVVWNDLNGDGLRGSTENGIPSVRVELWRDANNDLSDGAESRIGWTFTDSRGLYYFSGQTEGRYQIRIPASNFASGLPLAGAGFSSAVTVTTDNRIDNDDNGIQDGGSHTQTVSPIITLTAGAEPLGNAVTGTESGTGGELDDYTVDANGDMTVDFGFVEPGMMAIGNLVFNDTDGDRHFDVGEGVDGVLLHLYSWGQTPGVDQPLATTTTANGGRYLFSGLWQGQYFVHVPASQFLSNASLRGLYSLEGTQSGDDDVGEDSIDAAVPTLTGLSTGRIILTNNSAPTGATTETGYDADSDAENDNNVDLTVDIGVYRPVALGNLVFVDANSNGHYDAGEGLDGVTLQLYHFEQTPGTDTPLATTVSLNGGRYLFDSILPGKYLVHVPKAMFALGAPLYQRVSINEGLSGDDDVGENGINDGDPMVKGVTSDAISLFPGGAPTDGNGETGLDGTSDNENDAAVDLTVDFGFQNPVGLGNLVFMDTNGNGHADVGEGRDGIRVEVYREGQDPGTSLPLFSQLTVNGGRYFFNFLTSGRYVVHIPASEFAAGRPLYETVSVLGAQTDTADDNIGEDGIDAASPALTGISSRVITLAVNTAPTNTTTETGLFATDDDSDDNNFDLTVDFGFAEVNPDAVGVGNLVFLDGNANGIYDDGEGVDNVRVQLFADGADPQTATPLATTITAGGGIYLFGNLLSGDYIVHIPAGEFATGKPLFGWNSLPGQGEDTGTDDDSDENGSDGDPVSSGVTSTTISLQPGNEPENIFGETGRDAFMDDANDANTDLTVDFGFSRLGAIGNLVFLDSNYNGRADTGEALEGIEVQLYEFDAQPGFDLPVATAVSDGEGRYLFTDILPGDYYLHVPYTEFLNGRPLFRHASVAGVALGDDNIGEDGLDDGRPDINGIRTAVFTLNPAACPAGSQEGGQGGDSDDATDISVDLTKDFGFVPSVQIGNLVFGDSNGDGIFDPNTELGIPGVTIQLWSNSPGANGALASTTTSAGGLYSFNIAPGSYHLRVPASQFEDDSPLENLIPSVATPNVGGVFVDDNAGQDAFTSGSVTSVGARTAAFAVLPDLAPGESNGETGHLSFDDDAFEANSDLTVDLGFSPKPITVGNLVFADVNTDGRFSTANDFGVPGVLVQLFRTGETTSSPPLAQMYTRTNGTYELKAPGAGSYYLHIPANQFAVGGPLASATTVPGFGNDDGTDDNLNEDTLDAANPAGTGVNSIVFELAYGTEPTDTKETGFAGTQDAGYDTDGDMTIDLGFRNVTVPTNLGIGNLVFRDENANGHYDSGEGVSGVWVLLYRSSDQPGVSTPYASTFTDSAGRYLFPGLRPGGYIVHVAADNFKPDLTSLGEVALPQQADGPLYNDVSVTGQTTGDDNVGEDGVDAANPSLTGISSGVVILQPGQAPTGTAEAGFDGTSDDASDANYNLTIDFGFVAVAGEEAPQNLGIGNVVFKDANSNGVFNSGEGASGVLMHLYRGTDIPGVSTPLMTTTTDSLGRYLFSNLTAGSYIVHVAADNFKAGLLGLLGNGPLFNHLSITGRQTSKLDDNLGEDGVDAATPALTGISSLVINLQPGTAPTGSVEGGFSGTSDDAMDADYDLTIDFGFKSNGLLGGGGILGLSAPDAEVTTSSAASASSSMTWESVFDSIGRPEDDLDADGLPNLLEYALGTDAASGIQTPSFFLQTDPATGHVDAVVIRPSGGRADIIYQLETQADLQSGVWSVLNKVPSITQNNDGFETLRYASVASAGELGFLRVKAGLDADLNGTPEASVTSMAQAWVRRDITDQQSFSMPLLTADVYRGTRPNGVKSKLETGRAYYVEVLGGADEGKRYELDEATTTNAKLAFESAVPSLTGVRLAVRPHWTVDTLFPVDSFLAGSESGNADRLLFFDRSSGSFRTSWLSADGWTGDSNGSRIVAPGEGLLVQARHGTVSLTFTGAVRDTKFALPLSAGAQFIGSGYPVARSARTLGLTTGAGFTASATPAQATRLRLWNGDLNAGDNSYSSLFLQTAPSLWVDEANAVDVSGQPLLDATRAWFLVTPDDVPGYKEP